MLTVLGGSFTVHLTTCFLLGFSCFAKVELITVLLVWANPTSQTGGQPYSDTSPPMASVLCIGWANQVSLVGSDEIMSHWRLSPLRGDNFSAYFFTRTFLIKDQCYKILLGCKHWLNENNNHLCWFFCSKVPSFRDRHFEFWIMCEFANLGAIVFMKVTRMEERVLKRLLRMNQEQILSR